MSVPPFLRASTDSGPFGKLLIWAFVGVAAEALRPLDAVLGVIEIVILTGAMAANVEASNSETRNLNMIGQEFTDARNYKASRYVSYKWIFSRDEQGRVSRPVTAYT